MEKINFYNKILQSFKESSALTLLPSFISTKKKQKFIEGLADRAWFREIVLGNDVKREGNIFKLRELFENVEKFDPNWNIVLPL